MRPPRGAVVGRVIGLTALLALTLQVLARASGPHPGDILWFLHGVNLVTHEAGHVIFAIFGEFMDTAGGSLGQVLIPVIATIAFLGTRQPSSAAVTLFWTGQSLTVRRRLRGRRPRDGAAASRGGAHPRLELPVGRLGTFHHAEALGGLIFGLGALTMLAAVGLLGLDLLRARHGDPIDTDGGRSVE